METGIKWGDVATWVTGIATLLLFAGAYWQIHIERQARIEREKERDLRRIRSQAEHLSTWIAKEIQASSQIWIAISNQSTGPVYEVIVSVVMIQGSGPHKGSDTSSTEQSCLSVAPPGLSYTSIISHYHGMSRHPGIEIAFKDGAGKSWLRTAHGDLAEIDKPPVEYYELSRPLSWRFPDTEMPKDGVSG